MLECYIDSITASLPDVSFECEQVERLLIERKTKKNGEENGYDYFKI